MSERYPVVPMSPLFDACYGILQQEIRPFHYVELTEAALDVMNIPKRSVHWPKQIEDVREKLADKKRGRAKWSTIRYTGEPLCVVVLSTWLRNENNPTLIDRDPPLVIRASTEAAIEATFQALMRDMVKKTPAPWEVVMRSRARGIQIEKAVSKWFKDRWPEFYREPANQNEYDKPCNHDFRLHVSGRTYEIDVTGPANNGYFCNPGGGKKPADFHVCADIQKDKFVIVGVVTGKQFIDSSRKSPLPIYSMMAPHRMAFWLNCVRHGYSVCEIEEAVGRRASA